MQATRPKDGSGTEKLGLEEGEKRGKHSGARRSPVLQCLWVGGGGGLFTFQCGQLSWLDLDVAVYGVGSKSCNNRSKGGGWVRVEVMDERGGGRGEYKV